MKRWNIGLVALAVAAVLYGGSKPPTPPTPPKKYELVIIIEPIGDGMYSTRYLQIEKETLHEIETTLAH